MDVYPTGAHMAQFQGSTGCQGNFRSLLEAMQNDADRLHTVPAPPCCWAPCPMGINLGNYKIEYFRAFGLHEAIRAVQKRKYDIMILTETNIHN